jgi:peptide/nickel transport system substrate-binding protein
MNKFCMALLSGALMMSAAQAQELRVGLSGTVTSLDPMFHYTTINDNIARNIFEQLVLKDEKLSLKPALATSWTNIDPTTWEFTLRQNVRFHDGSAFTAEDVVFSLRRPPNVPNSPSSYAGYVSAIKTIEIMDPHKIRITTKAPYPLLPLDLSIIHVMSATAAAAKTTDALNRGEGLVGTGPFKFVSWQNKDTIELRRHDEYWGRKSEWAAVRFRPLTNDGARTAALLAGDLDLIENVPIDDMARISADGQFRVVKGPSNRIMYLALDAVRQATPFATDKSGTALTSNPLADVRVRQAISMAINRPAMVDRIMAGQAVAASQLHSPAMAGHNKELKMLRYDPAVAKSLLQEAGFPDGFRLTLHGSNDRYVKADSVLQAMAQMLQRIGIDAKVEVMPHSVFRSRGSKLEFSAQFGGWAADDVSSPLRALVATSNRETGFGSANRGPYANAEFDRVLVEALGTFDEKARASLFDQAGAMAVKDLAVIPLYFELATWAMKGTLDFKFNVNQETLAQNVTRR